MIRQPAVSGRFYPSSSSELIALIENSYNEQLGVGKANLSSDNKLVGMIVPHAGYIFSGPVASWAYARLKAEEKLPEKIIILGPKHTQYGETIAISNAQSWTTPLGEVKVDRELANRLVAKGVGFKLDDDAHQLEHSIEVQLPFLQHLYSNKKFAIIPIAIGYTNFDKITSIASALTEVVKEAGEKVCVIISSDFSHDTPRQEAYELDGQAIKLIEQLDAKAFYKLVVAENRSICGLMPICVALEMFAGQKIKARKLKYATSMDIMEHDRGVGYASIVLEAEI